MVLGLLALPSAASAESFSAKFAGTALGSGVQVSLGSQDYWVFAGQLSWDADGFGDFLSFCVQLTSPLQSTQGFGTSLPGHINSDTAAKIGKLLTTNFDDIDTPWEAAGMQLAIWNLVHDGDDRADQGILKSTTQAAYSIANMYLAGLDIGKGPIGQVIFLDSYTNPKTGANGQDQVIYSTPEPGTLLLLGTSALALAARRRKQNKAN